MTPFRTTRWLSLLSLEDRTVPATAGLRNGILTINGGLRDDTILVRQVNNEISVDGLRIAFKGKRVERVATTDVTLIKIFGRGGADTIRLEPAAGGGQQDITKPLLAFGGAGNDSITGGSGRDTFNGGLGDDSLVGAGNVDTIDYADARGVVTVNLATRAVSGAAGADTVATGENIICSRFADSLTGNDEDNLLVGGKGNDSLVGLAGEDTFRGGLGDDDFEGGLGFDLADYSDSTAGVTVHLLAGKATGGAGTDTFSSIIDLVGSRFNDLLVGDNTDNIFDGGAGNDTLIGLGGPDTMDGGAGNDLILGGIGDDNLAGEEGNDTIDGGAGNDDINGNGGADLLIGDLGTDVLRQNNEADTDDEAVDVLIAIDGVAESILANTGDVVNGDPADTVA